MSLITTPLDHQPVVLFDSYYQVTYVTPWGTRVTDGAAQHVGNTTSVTLTPELGTVVQTTYDNNISEWHNYSGAGWQVNVFHGDYTHQDASSSVLDLVSHQATNGWHVVIDNVSFTFGELSLYFQHSVQHSENSVADRSPEGVSRSANENDSVSDYVYVQSPTGEMSIQHIDSTSVGSSMSQTFGDWATTFLSTTTSHDVIDTSHLGLFDTNGTVVMARDVTHSLHSDVTDYMGLFSGGDRIGHIENSTDSLTTSVFDHGEVTTDISVVGIHLEQVVSHGLDWGGRG